MSPQVTADLAAPPTFNLIRQLDLAEVADRPTDRPRPNFRGLPPSLTQVTLSGGAAEIIGTAFRHLP